MKEDDLHAWADSQLDPTERAVLEAHFLEHPQDAERARSYRNLNEALREAYEPVLEQPVPERFLKRPAPWRRMAATYGKAAGLVAIGLLAGWFGRGLMPATQSQAVLTLPRQAAIAHAVYAPEVRHPVEVTAKEEDHLVRWLSKRLGTELKCPKLSAYGFELVGGRLLSGSNGPVAHFMFQDSRGARLTLYVSGRTDSRETAFRYSQEERVSVFYWIDGRYGYALSGEMGREQLLNIANAVYQQLNP